jgi:hypothetical protein
MIFVATLESGYRSAMMAGMRLLLLDEPFEHRLGAILFESRLARAYGLLDRVFVIDRGAVAEKT